MLNRATGQRGLSQLTQGQFALRRHPNRCALCASTSAARCGEHPANAAHASHRPRVSFISGNSTERRTNMVNSTAGTFTPHPRPFSFLSPSLKVSERVPVVIVLGPCKSSPPEGPGWSPARSPPTFLGGGRRKPLSPRGLYLHNLLYISIEGQ